MVNFPTAPQNTANGLDFVQDILGVTGSPGAGGFAPGLAPISSGLTRQDRLPNGRPAVNTRKIMHWLVPEQPIVQMYVNPQNVTYADSKSISSQRTKGGFLLQYWGEELGTIRLAGTTGTSGIEGINVLRDVYRSEQLSYDPYAQFLVAQQDQTALQGLGTSIGNSIGGSVGSIVGSAVGGLLQSALDATNPTPRPTPSLAQLAFTVELYWSGEVFRGFFRSFTVTESADNLGLFNYDAEFVVTQRRGFRQNFLAWHRSATSGPSNTNPQFGTPYSFGNLVSGQARSQQSLPFGNPI